MSWALWLTLAVVVSVLFALFGVRPRGARPVGSTRLMTIARVILIAVILLLFYLFLRGRAAG